MVGEDQQRHAFRSLRHFPEVSSSVSLSAHRPQPLPPPQQQQQQQKNKKKKEKKPPLRKSTHRLEELCRSSHSELSALSLFRKQIINDRERPTPQAALALKRSKAKETDALTSGNEKLTKFAIAHDARRMNTDLEGFDGHILSKEQFDYQLKRCLTIYLTPAELDAVFESMDTDKSTFIDGVEFLRYFFKLGQDARDRIRAETAAASAKAQAAKDRAALDERQRICDENMKFQISASPEQMEAAMNKLREFVANFACTLDCIEFRDIRGFLSPLEFKTVLEKLCKTRFTYGEIAALLSKYGEKVSQKMVKDGAWCLVDGNYLIKCFVDLRRQEVSKNKDRELANSQRYLQVQESLGGNIDVFPKCLGR